MSKTPSRFFAPSERSFREEMGLLKSAGSELARMNSDLAAQLNELSEAQSQLRASVQEYHALEKDESAGQQRLLNKITECLDSVSNMLTGIYMADRELITKTDSASGALSGLQTTFQELLAKTDAVIEGISGLYQKDFPLDVCFEREYYKDFPVCGSPETPGFQKDFLSLVDGLDEESIETVVLALQRLKLVQNSGKAAMALYSEEEKLTVRSLVEHFYSNILELSDSCYFYRGYLLPINHFEPCVFWDRCGVPLLEHPEQLADRDIIDAGAFIGDSALILAPLTRRNVYAFEPMPSNYELLLKTIELNSMTNVLPYNMALGEKRGKSVFTVGGNGSASTQFLRDGINYHERVEADIVTLDELVRENALNVGLIKADVEGAEQLLLRGAMETIKAQKPALLISIYHNAGDFFGIKPWLDWLNLGYKFKIRHPVGGTVMTEMLLIAEAQ